MAAFVRNAAQFPIARAGLDEISDLLLDMLVGSVHQHVLLSGCARPPGQTAPTRPASAPVVWLLSEGDDNTCAGGHRATPRGSPRCSRAVAGGSKGDKCCPHSPDPTPAGPVAAPVRSRNRAAVQAWRAGTCP